QHEAPHRGGQVDLQPGVSKPLPALVDALLQPRVPGIDKVLWRTTLQEVPPAGEFPVETHFGESAAHGCIPQRKPESASRTNGLRIELASSTTRIECAPALNVTSSRVSESRLTR